MNKWGGAIGALVVASLSACFAVPDPLAPGIRGSVGRPSYGVLTGAVSLPMTGPGFVRIHDNAVHFGSPRLVRTIERAALEVAAERPGSPRLVIGDLSKEAGGKAEGHASHRSGRDADILYFVTTPDGAPVESPGFVRFGPDGLGEVPRSSKRFAGRILRLDVARTWLLVKALIQTPGANVQWIFAARPIQALLVEEARARGEDPHLVWYAENVLHQPTDSEAHDDHMHVRLACDEDDAVHGCEGGPDWPFLPAPPSLEISDEEEVAALFEP